MNKHLLFRNYWWIALLGVIIGIVCVIVFASNDRIALLGSVIAGGLGFCYFVQQQHLSETSLFKNLFTEFNARYGNMNDMLLQIRETGGGLSPEQRQTIVDYFNLCGEEFLFFKEGYIHPCVWRAWCRGMLFYFQSAPFEELWKKENKADSPYYELSIEEIHKGADYKRGQVCL